MTWTTTDLHAAQRLSVAPMMACTDRHARYLLRLISTHTLLYTEMVACGAVVHGDKRRHLDFDVSEHPVALQLGGNDPVAMAKAAECAQHWQYDEVNINVGCPSARVKSGAFGAALMAHPEVVADCVRHMRSAGSVPVTVKTRIGIDDLDSYAHLQRFISTVADAGCETFTIHARKAWLNGLSPKENREIPPLRYDIVYQLVADFPELRFILNGGVTDLSQALHHLETVDGVMIGRAAYQQPYLLADADKFIFGTDADVPSRTEVIARYSRYARQMSGAGVPLAPLLRPLLGMFHSQPGGRHWRRHISEHAHRHDASINIIDDAMATMQQFDNQVETAA